MLADEADASALDNFLRKGLEAAYPLMQKYLSSSTCVRVARPRIEVYVLGVALGIVNCRLCLLSSLEGKEVTFRRLSKENQFFSTCGLSGEEFQAAYDIGFSKIHSCCTGCDMKTYMVPLMEMSEINKRDNTLEAINLYMQVLDPYGMPRSKYRVALSPNQQQFFDEIRKASASVVERLRRGSPPDEPSVISCAIGRLTYIAFQYYIEFLGDLKIQRAVEGVNLPKDIDGTLFLLNLCDNAIGLELGKLRRVETIVDECKKDFLSEMVKEKAFARDILLDSRPSYAVFHLSSDDQVRIPWKKSISAPPDTKFQKTSELEKSVSDGVPRPGQ